MTAQSNGDGEGSGSRVQAVTETAASRVVPRPVPCSQSDDPRGYQLDQLRRRYSPVCTTAADGSTSVVFQLKPSDPDFPFELTSLDCDLRVPEGYPRTRPTLRVRNKDIPRGFSINVERGWDRLADERRGSTLLALTRALDKNLEAFLSEQRVDTVKLVGFQGTKDTRHVRQQQDTRPSTTGAPPAVTEQTQQQPGEATAAAAAAPLMRERSYTRDEIAEAKARRAREVRQLDSRMGKMPMFRRSADGVVFTLPIEPKRRTELPRGLMSVTTVHLIVPLLYPLQELRLQLNDVVAEEAEPVEDMFTQKSTELRQMSLMSHINYLTQNLHAMARKAQTMAKAKADAEARARAEAGAAAAAPRVDTAAAQPSEEDKGRVQVIPRPPEWTTADDGDSSDADSDADDTDGDGGVSLEPEPGNAPVAAAEDAAERGTMLSFPRVELHGIELLEVSVLGLTVRCERCKTVNELKGLRPGQEKRERCEKCSSPMAARFRAQAVHENSTRAGFVDMAGAKVADLLPSTFVPTCSRCSTAGPELVSVRGEAMTNVCRACHAKFTFKLPEVRFTVVTAGRPAADGSEPGSRRGRERLGLHAGEPLPSRGACGHYRKSYRWFRFSCCGRVHACDKCHDAAEDHENDWARRMICGWCSREQRYSPEACGFCGRSVIGRKGRGFWEGGKGTRDQRLMSRKDPRKHKRIGGQA
ncbi:CHY zinc finger [Geosmithia morbida]|uniref:CHY zinc finger n=1 Tax=Geosmithia morbida TaxID=1094350 RepID=A0A9P5CXM6_9HYPO|nr:CHY zinc finger [Geosmithia morbida]KAF4119448.1 CHY zinc finger [Geosmithia morbida]